MHVAPVFSGRVCLQSDGSDIRQYERKLLRVIHQVVPDAKVVYRQGKSTFSIMSGTTLQNHQKLKEVRDSALRIGNNFMARQLNIVLKAHAVGGRNQYGRDFLCSANNKEHLQQEVSWIVQRLQMP